MSSRRLAPVVIVGIVGSLRKASTNRIVFEAAIDLAGSGLSLVEAPIGEVPFYDADVEEKGDPPSVTALKQAVSEGHGVIFFTPEYNGSLPAVVKNALDWLSRPYGSSAIETKPVGVVAATPGRHEVSGVREQMAAGAAAVKADYFSNSIGISSINHRIDDGVLVDVEAQDAVRDWLVEFHGFVVSRHTNRPT